MISIYLREGESNDYKDDQKTQEENGCISKKSEVENMKTHTEMKNTIMETKNTLEGINSRLNDTKEMGSENWKRENENHCC